MKIIDIYRENIWKNSQTVIPETWHLNDKERKRAFTLSSCVVLDFTINVTLKYRKKSGGLEGCREGVLIRPEVWRSRGDSPGSLPDEDSSRADGAVWDLPSPPGRTCERCLEPSCEWGC